MLDQILRDLENKFNQTIILFEEELNKIRAGKANTSLIENIKVQYYENLMPIREMASISTPNPTTITVLPWDKNALGDIELAIRNANLNLNPVNDGSKISIYLPAPTEEERKKLVKLITSLAEETKIQIRNLREESWKKVQALEKDKKLTEDDRYRGEELLNKIVERYNQKIKDIITNKEKSILQI